MTKSVEELAKDVAEQLFIVQQKENELALAKETIRQTETQIKALEEHCRKLKQEISSIRFVIAERIGTEQPELPQKVK